MPVLEETYGNYHVKVIWRGAILAKNHVKKNSIKPVRILSCWKRLNVEMKTRELLFMGESFS